MSHRARWRWLWVRTWVSLGLVGLSLASTAFGVAAGFKEARAEDARAAEWDAKEVKCLEDPKCDLARFDRMRELGEGEKGYEGFAQAFVSLVALTAAGLWAVVNVQTVKENWGRDARGRFA